MNVTSRIIKTTNRQMKRCTTSLIIREMQIKITMRTPLTSIRMASITKTRNTDDGEGVEKREFLCAVGEIVNWYSHYGKQYDRSSEKKR